MEEEIWKDIPEYEGLYQISNNKRIRRLETIGKDGRILMPKILKKSNNNGYEVIELRKNGKKKVYYINRLYYETFQKGKFYDKENDIYIS